MAVSPDLAGLDQALRSQVTAAKPIHVLDGPDHSEAFLDGRRHFPPQQHVEDVVVDVVVVAAEPVYPP